MSERGQPWTPEQVDALNRFQHDPLNHPFTCGSRDVPRSEHPDGKGVLRATPDGWVCDHCGYRQEWCHDWMAAANPTT